MEVFDAHCHYQDPGISHMAPKLIESALQSGVVKFTVNGIHKKDWHLVKQMSEDYPCAVPNFGLHRGLLQIEALIGSRHEENFLRQLLLRRRERWVLTKGLMEGRQIFNDWDKVLQKQLELAKELNKPALIHCVRAFGYLLQILKQTGPFPASVILHCCLVPQFVEAGAYFSFSGFLMSMKQLEAKNTSKTVPVDRISLKTGTPDALPVNPTFVIDDDACSSMCHTDEGSSKSTSLTESMNHPANIFAVLNYVTSLLDMPPEDLAELSCKNAVRLFSYEGSKILLDKL